MKIASGRGRETLLRAWEGYGKNNFFFSIFFFTKILKREKICFFLIFSASERGQPWKIFFICYGGEGVKNCLREGDCVLEG